MAIHGNVSAVPYPRGHSISEKKKASFYGIVTNYGAAINAMSDAIADGADKRMWSAVLSVVSSHETRIISSVASVPRGGTHARPVLPLGFEITP